MTVEDVKELLPEIYQRSSALQQLITRSLGVDVSKKPAAKGKKKVSAKPGKTAKERKKKAQKAVEVENSTISIPEMANDTTISTSDPAMVNDTTIISTSEPTISISHVALQLPSNSSNLLSSLAAAASEAPAMAETSTTAAAEEAAETPTTSFGKFDETPTELHFNNIQAQNLVNDSAKDDVADYSHPYVSQEWESSFPNSNSVFNH
jgi:hypothetical protein